MQVVLRQQKVFQFLYGREKARTVGIIEGMVHGVSQSQILWRLLVIVSSLCLTYRKEHGQCQKECPCTHNCGFIVFCGKDTKKNDTTKINR